MNAGPPGGSHWFAAADQLREAYLREAGTIRFELVTRALLAALPAPGRVADIGGGFGLQAVLLARAGHTVTVLDPDPAMLAIAETRAAAEPAPVRARIRCVQGLGEEAPALIGEGYDLVCCHSVLQYLDEFTPLLRALVAVARPGGLLSVMSLNPDANAMRSGLQGRWREAIATLRDGVQRDGRYLEAREHRREAVAARLRQLGARSLGWHGVGVFTDHHEGTIEAEDPAEVILAEWLAGTRDPYRRVARCWHLLAERGSKAAG